MFDESKTNVWFKDRATRPPDSADAALLTRQGWKRTTDLRQPIHRVEILSQEAGLTGHFVIPEQWNLNDFGPLAFQVGDTDEFIHTQPRAEAGGALAGPSHGCIHIVPADRDDMVGHGCLQGGVTLRVRGYAAVPPGREAHPGE